MQQRTYQTRLVGDPNRDAVLLAYADLYGRAERTLFARLTAGESLTALKRAFLVRFGLTARQFNALAVELTGTMRSIRKARVRSIDTVQRRIARAQRVLATIPTGTHGHHQKRRRLAVLQRRLAALQADERADRVRLCFGSRKLFRAQFALAATGYRSQEAWRRAWRAARAAQFFVLGSKDETAGCQGCVATVDAMGAITLRLRLPHALLSAGTHLVIPGLRFRYGHDGVTAAVGRNLSSKEAEHEAICWRFVRDRKGWVISATVSVPAGARVTREGIGVVGVDLNGDHVAATELDRFGNPVAALRIPCATYGKSRAQRAAVLGDAVKRVVAYAQERRKPIILERLDFAGKKAALEQRGRGYARILSGFAYATFAAMLAARAYDVGIDVRTVHPAYTSVIGSYTFAQRYGLSVHQAAACSVGRRGMRLAERPPRQLGDQVTFSLPVRNRGTHVWSFWRAVARRAAAHAARGRPGRVGPILAGTGSSNVGGTARWAIRSSAAGGIPAREPSAALFG